LKTIIIGGGIMGLCTAWALANQGEQVTLLEQYSLPNYACSSFDQHRVIRYPYGLEIGYCSMVNQAFQAWETLWQSLGQSYYIETATLDLSDTIGDLAELSRNTLDRLGIPYQIIEGKRIESHYPFLSSQNIRSALFVKQGGVLFADQIIKALCDYLPRQGVQLCPNVAVIDIDLEQKIVILKDGTRLRSDCLIIATGAWLNQLLPQYEQTIKSLRQVVAYFEPPEQWQTAWKNAPAILATGPDKRYVIPPVAKTGLKFAAGKHTFISEPNGDRTVTAKEGRQVLDYFAPWFNLTVEYKFVEAKVCYYSMTKDTKFRLEPIGDHIWVFSACSGHGFKFAPLLALSLVETLRENKDPEHLINWAKGFTFS
jgi:glycine/D-amino acid oxidase-like deaminating enzyme